jgi:hypothetical protein
VGLRDAVERTGPIPDDGSDQDVKKRYSEVLSGHLAREVSSRLRELGFRGVRPVGDEKGEREFQGGLGPKRVDVSSSDERHGLILAVSIKTICFAPFGKNLRNRFADLCTEAVSLHLRFPYSVICGLFALPIAADRDHTDGRALSTFRRTVRLFGTITGRSEYTDPSEKFEDVTLMLFEPVQLGSQANQGPRLVSATDGRELTEAEYFERIRQIHNRRYPHVPVGESLEG